MRKLKKAPIILLVLLITIMASGIISADSGSKLENLSVLEKGETLGKSGFFAGDIVRIEGTVEGAVFAVGNEVRINGDIDGDVFVAARRLYVDGEIKGNIYGIGVTTSTGAKVEKDLFLGGWNIEIGENASINRDLFVVGRSVLCNGTVGRDFLGGGLRIAVNGIVGGGAGPEGEEPSAQSIRYLSEDGFNTEKYGIYTVVSEASRAASTTPKYTNILDTLKSESSDIVGALIIWGLVSFWRPSFWSGTAQTLRESPFRAFGIGLVCLIIVPIVSIALLFTGFGVPLGIIAGVVYGVSIYISKLVVATFLGYWIFRKLKLPEIHRGVWAFLSGIVIITVLSIPQVPIMEFGTGFLTICLGIGALVLVKYKVETK